MTKQEEIREGVDKIISNPLPAYHPQIGLTYSSITGKALETMRDNILSYLHSQGVVIKVDRELPTKVWDEFIEHDWVDITLADKSLMKGMLNAGYVAVEPLVNEGL